MKPMQQRRPLTTAMMMLSDKLYDLMDKGPFRALSLVLAFAVAFCVFWDPSRFAAATSSLEVWQEVFIVWAVCTGVIHGVGFRPKRMWLRAFFSPLPAIVILGAGLFYFFV
ncbi:cyd operon protein YbgE [Yersinia intermedia]|uniref:Cyd operon protein YbgE n=3 Tax=Yersiniaceae TaxID=1903411 RepID=A0A208ZS86_YERIN|nr:cyd operon protein YbgE [Yersinia sp. FDAARGOS_228]AVL35618.1 cyd operon protein YbgE [Yersinia intermedia]OVZ72936.1 cyd operon protein YbgE [Yersinia intermedia]OVZ83325.1 cyd operon protein YbgE [Yersinia intermedia]OWF86804.1 cyd operon protein YbgE [Yersinia intermedia]